MTTVRYTWTEPNGTRHTDWTVELMDAGADPAFPIVILLHGLGGHSDPMDKHMADPAVKPGANYNMSPPAPTALVDRGWHGYPNVGIWGFWSDTTTPVVGWEPYLNGLRYPTINYAQVDPDGLLARPVTQLEGIVRAVLAQTTKRVVFLCHSRGGLLIRLFLQRNRNDIATLQRIKGVVTLHSPHQGSNVANLATTIRPIVASLLAQGGGLLRGPLLHLNEMVSGPGIVELRTDSQLLASLRTGEATPLPVAIPFYTFGGTSPRLMRVRAWWFDWLSAIPQWHWPPFNWRTYPGAIGYPGGPFAITTVVDGIPILRDLIPEARMGIGELLCTDANSRLPFAVSHRTNPINHAQALWDTTLKGQVKTILNTFR
jgi:hypothetical protein